LHASFARKLFDALDVDRAPGAARAARSEPDGVAFVIQSAANPIDPAVAQRLVDRFRPREARLAGAFFIIADLQFRLGRVMTGKPLTKFGWRSEKLDVHILRARLPSGYVPAQFPVRLTHSKLAANAGKSRINRIARKRNARATFQCHERSRAASLSGVT